MDLPQNTRSLDRSLTKSRSARRLESVVSSVESFLNGQVERLEQAIQQCNQAVDNDRIVQSIMADFELRKQEWESQRASELARLELAGNELAKAWEQLETERRRFAEQS